jgi:hypothetical protein
MRWWQSLLKTRRIVNEDGVLIAVVSDSKHAPLVAAAPDLLDAAQRASAGDPFTESAEYIAIPKQAFDDLYEAVLRAKGGDTRFEAGEMRANKTAAHLGEQQ